MLDDNSRKEQLSRAFVTAVAAHAGIKCHHQTDLDVGVDGHFKEVRKRQTSRTRLRKRDQTEVPVRIVNEFGVSLEFQLKSSSGCVLNQDSVIYSADSSDYDKLVDVERMAPILLIVLALPQDQQQWVKVEEDHTKLNGRCFYHFVPTGPMTTTKSKVKIVIPRTQTLTASSLKKLMDDHQERFRPLLGGQNVKSV
ncbi:MAG: DUF4365 domain-containing protein [Cyanobacteria bacterium SZAS-4]|nr:DUF4365 domain-containing protein [Cyanobacteria bacterium SZAS-4]